MANGPPPRSETTTGEPSSKPKTNGSWGSLALRFAAMGCLLAIALLDDRSRTLHDMLSGTLAVRRSTSSPL